MRDMAFTCLLPVWAGDDARQFLQAVLSLVRNTSPPAHIVLCEDGELPAPLEAAAAAVARKFKAIRSRNPGPRGLHANLNQGARLVATPWICRADADDINLPNRLAAQAAFLEAHPEVSVLGGDITEFWPDGATRVKSTPQRHDDIVRYARFRNPINHMTAVFSHDAFRACGGYPAIDFKEDYALWLTMIRNGYRLANLGESLVRARLGTTFYERRAGWRNLRSEWALFRIKRLIPGIGLAPAAMALVARSGALADVGLSRAAYETVLRRRESEDLG
jgi:glycosyltransferase involved in cell wall biosynthesis